METLSRQRHPTARPAPARPRWSPEHTRDPSRGLYRETRHDTGRVHRPRPEPAGQRMVRRALRDHAANDFRADVEGLRAIAVIAVVLFHADLFGITGGYIGVDVFFVVSGFLITRLLVRELATTGTLSLTRFWARRMRRLLPASALTVLATVAVGAVVLSPLALRTLAQDTVASGTYSSNFVFASRLGDYFGQQLSQSVPSPLLHMWSLAVEEQFYVIWPVIVVLLTLRPRQYRRLLLTVIGVLFVAGTALSIWWTGRSQAWAYYMLPARMSELLAGAGIAVAGAAVTRLPGVWRAAAGWAGLAAIAWTLWGFDGSTRFPGSAALLPVLATVALIVAGGRGVPGWAPARLLDTPVLQWIGTHSYALYLWHWPVLVLMAARFGPLTVIERVIAVGLAVGLAAGSLRAIEDPARHSRWLTADPVRSLALGSLFCLTLTFVGWRLSNSNQQLSGGGAVAAATLEATPTEPANESAVEPATIAPAAAPPTVAAKVPATVPATVPAKAPSAVTAGAPPTSAASTIPAPTTTLALPTRPAGRLAALTAATQKLLTASLAPAPVPSNLKPSLRSARVRTRVYDDGCVNIGSNAKVQVCRYGAKGSAKRMVLYGDSHAAQWFDAINDIALTNGYELIVLLKSGCPYAEVPLPTPLLGQTCPAYRDRVLAWITKNKPDVVVVSSSYLMPTNGGAVRDLDPETWEAGVTVAVDQLAKAAPRLAIIGDNPTSKKDPPDCLAGHLGDASACNVARSVAVRADRRSAEVAAARASGAVFIDTADWFCAKQACPMIVGDVLMLRDETHITQTASRLLQPLLAAALAPLLAR